MAAQTEIPMEDAELDALMAELDAETAGMIETPTLPAAPAPEAEPTPPEIDDQDGAELDDAAAQAAAAEEAEMAALQAELDAAETKDQKLDVAVKVADKLNETLTKAMPEAAAEVARTLTPEKLKEAAAKITAPKPELASAPNPRPPKRQPQLQFFLDIDKFKTDISVSENNLDNRMMQQAGDFAYHAAELARAEAQYARVKLRFEGIEARIYGAHRKALLDAGEKVTEKMVENAVRVDAEYIQAKNLMIEAEMIVGFNKAAVEALRHRKDMIVQLGADRREEYKGQTRIVAAEANASDLRARALAVGKQAA